MPYRINSQGLPEYVEPDIDSMYGAPDYGGNYNSMLGMAQQPMSLGQLISVVREVQQNMHAPSVGNISSPTTLGQIPEQVPGAGLVSRARPKRTGTWVGADLYYEPVPPVEEITKPAPDIPGKTGGGSGGGAGDYDYGAGAPTVTLPKGSGGNTGGTTPETVPRKKKDPGKLGTSGGSGASGAGGTGSHWY